jgi:hypothetical protein
MLRAAQTATCVGRDLDCGPNQHRASHRSEAMRIAGHIRDSLASKQQRRFLWSDWFAAPTLSSKWAVTSSCARGRGHVGMG